MKNKTAIIAIVVLLALLGIGGGYFLFAQKSAPKQDSQIPQQQDQAIPTLSPDAIGLTMAFLPTVLSAIVRPIASGESVGIAWSCCKILKFRSSKTKLFQHFLQTRLV